VKKRKKNIAGILGLMALLYAGCTGSQEFSEKGEKQVVDYVNPYMGNISHLLVPTFPTIHLPNSMLRVYPERRNFTRVRLHGLPLVVTSHRGSSAFNLSPYQGEESPMNPVTDFSYDQEKLTPCSYSVYLDEIQVQVDYGLSHQSAAYQLEFEKDDPVSLVLNSKKGAMKWDGKAVSGYQILENDTQVYLYFLPESIPVEVVSLNEGTSGDAIMTEGVNACLVLKYPRGTTKLQVKYGISFIDEAQARANMEREVLGKTVSGLQEAGRSIWNEALGRVHIKGGTDDDRAVFYTSLYRCFERPVCISEDGRYYSAFDGQVHADNGRPFYTDDWIWDSYRAHHPLRILLDAQQEEDILNSFVLMSEQMDRFWWPTFPEITGDSRRMNSNHGVASVLDAHRKGL